jgi:flagellar hook-associated protein 3 FlgL
MRVVNFVPDVQYQMQQSQNNLSTALQQVSTGLRVNQLSDDPAASANLVSSLAASANVDQYTHNISAMQSRMQTADSSISSAVTSLNTAITAGTSGANGTNTAANREALAEQVQGAFNSVLSQANTSFQGAYVFGGSVSTTPPFVQASTTYTSSQGSASSPLSMSTPLTAGSVTTISDATTGESLVFRASAGDTLGDLSTAINSAVASGTLSAGTSATINASGELSIGSGTNSGGIVVSSNDTALGSMSAAAGTQVTNSYAYVGTNTVNTVQVGDSLRVASNVPGSNLFGSGSNALSSLANLISALQTGNTTQIGAATTAVSSALNAMGQQRIPLDNGLNQLSSQDTYLGQETVTLSSQQTSLVGINLATAATNLSQAEEENSAVLGAAAKVIPQTLLDYLH